MPTFTNKTVFITGASRGIGKAIGVRLAEEGANVVIAAKTAEPHPRLPGTIYTAAEEMEAAGGQALPLVVDIRDENRVAEAVQEAVDTFGRIDMLVNNASAIYLAGTLETPIKRFDLMHEVNVRGTYVCSQACLPHLLEAERPHILNLAPPLTFETRWFAPHVAYSIAKYGMSLCVLGMAGEFQGRVGVNALWPRTTIATAAVNNLLGGDEMMRRSRWPRILADAAAYILAQDPATYSGQFLIDEDVLAAAGITDLAPYAVDPSADLQPDFFI